MPCSYARRSVTVLLTCAFVALAGVGCSEENEQAVGPARDDDAVVVAGSDAPLDLIVTAVSSDTVALGWRGGQDLVDGYEIRRDGQLVGTSRGTRYLDTGVSGGAHRYDVNGRTAIAVEGIDRSTSASTTDVFVPDAAALALQGGGRLLVLDGELDTSSEATLDASGRVAISGFRGDLFVVERLDESGSVAERRFLEGNETATLLAGADVWYVVGDDGEHRPVIALDPETLVTRWSIQSTTLALTGGCRFPALLADGALSCRGFADDTLRIGADGGVGPTSPGVRIPTGDRISADDGTLLIDVWTLPAATVPEAFFPIVDWVSRDVVTGAAIDRGRILVDDPAIDFPFTVDAVGVADGQVIVAGNVLANGCLRVCVDSLPIPPYVDGHFVARLDTLSGRVEAIERLPFGLPLGTGAGRAEGDTLVFTAQDRLSVLDIDALNVIDRRDVGGEPVALADSTLLTRVPGDESSGARWYRFAR